MDEIPSTNAASNTGPALAQALVRRLYGGAITVDVWKLRLIRQPYATDGDVFAGVAVSTTLNVEPLDPDTQSAEILEIAPQVFIRRGKTSALRLVTSATASPDLLRLDITLGDLHFSNALEALKGREPQEGDAPRGPSVVDLRISGHLSAAAQPVQGDLALWALAEDVVIFGWREEFGYHSDDAGSPGGNGAAAATSTEGALPRAVAAPPSVAVPASVPSVTAVVRGILDTPKQTPDGPPSCPRCNKPMKVKTAFRGRNAGGQFWGCYDYPGCKGTRDINRH